MAGVSPYGGLLPLTRAVAAVVMPPCPVRSLNLGGKQHERDYSKIGTRRGRIRDLRREGSKRRASAPITQGRVRKMTNLFPKTFLVMWIAVGALWAGTLHAQVADFVQVNLVSDLPGLATITEPELVNPWGVPHTTTSPFWTSNQGTRTATLFAVT